MKRVVQAIMLLLIPALFGGFVRPPLRWVAIGDSITYLNDHLDETKYRLTRGYLTDLTDRLPYIHYINQGRNGWSTTNFARSIEQLRSYNQPRSVDQSRSVDQPRSVDRSRSVDQSAIPVGDIYTVFLGTNDWWQGHRIGRWKDYEQATGDSTIYGCFRIIMDKIHQLNANAPVILITPMPRADFVYINDAKNNAYGSYREKDGQTLEQVAEAIIDIGRHKRLRVVDLYHEKRLAIPRLVRFKRLKDPQTGTYKNYPYPAYTTIPFNPLTDDYPYPPEAVDMTYDGLHPSNKGDSLIADKLVQSFSASRATKPNNF
jgi:lysophospholipase L1-like esterase